MVGSILRLMVGKLQWLWGGCDDGPAVAGGLFCSGCIVMNMVCGECNGGCCFLD